MRPPRAQWWMENTVSLWAICSSPPGIPIKDATTRGPHSLQTLRLPTTSATPSVTERNCTLRAPRFWAAWLLSPPSKGGAQDATACDRASDANSAPCSLSGTSLGSSGRTSGPEPEAVAPPEGSVARLLKTTDHEAEPDPNEDPASINVGPPRQGGRGRQIAQ